MLARYILEYACKVAEPGMTTDELDRLAHDEIILKGAYPSPLNYYGFPKSICTSVNDLACHGIPSKDVVLRAGDLLSVDVSIYYRGYHGDNCKSVIVGDSELDPSQTALSRRLIDTNEEALEKAINLCGPGRCRRNLLSLFIFTFLSFESVDMLVTSEKPYRF